MKTFVTALFLLLVSSVASAQTNECNTPALSGNVTVTSATFAFVACAVAAEEPDGVMVELNGVKSYVTKAPDGTPNSSGRVPFYVSVSLSGKGNHTVRTAPFTLTSTGVRQEGPLSGPFVLVFEKAAPATATTNHPR